MADLPAATPEQDQALRAAIGDRAGAAIITRYVIIAEGIQDDGGPSLIKFESPDLSAWDAIGMLRSLTAAVEYSFARTWDED